jgi:hypothetical protein
MPTQLATTPFVAAAASAGRTSSAPRDDGKIVFAAIMLALVGVLMAFSIIAGEALSAPGDDPATVMMVGP